MLLGPHAEEQRDATGKDEPRHSWPPSTRPATPWQPLTFSLVSSHHVPSVLAPRGSTSEADPPVASTSNRPRRRAAASSRAAEGCPPPEPSKAPESLGAEGVCRDGGPTRAEGLIAQDPLSPAVSTHTEGKWGKPDRPPPASQTPRAASARGAGGLRTWGPEHRPQHVAGSATLPTPSSPQHKSAGMSKTRPLRVAGSEAGLAVSTYFKTNKQKILSE